MARNRPSQRSAVVLNDMVRAAAEMLQYRYRSHGIELELSLADELPVLSADGDQIGQVVLNLLVNAQQALADAAGPRRVHVQTGIESAPQRPRAAGLAAGGGQRPGVAAGAAPTPLSSPSSRPSPRA
jgi:two-component system NtrC family sensor kinase